MWEDVRAVSFYPCDSFNFFFLLFTFQFSLSGTDQIRRSGPAADMTVAEVEIAAAAAVLVVVTVFSNWRMTEDGNRKKK